MNAPKRLRMPPLLPTTLPTPSETPSGTSLVALRADSKPAPKAPNFLGGVCASLDAAAKRLGFDAVAQARLRTPENVLHVEFPVRMDDGSTKTFDGWRTRHSTARGPGKGGIRVASGVDADQVGALAAEMPTKPAIHRLPLGGAKGGIDADARTMSAGEMARLIRGYVSSAMTETYERDGTMAFGPKTDIPAPDVGTSRPDVALMDVAVDELLGWLVKNGIDELDGFDVPRQLHAIDSASSKATPYLDAYLALFEAGAIDDLGLIASFTGKSVDHGGSLGRSEATGLGLAYAAIEALARQGVLTKGADRFDGQTIAVQGFGNVGAGAVRAFTDLGARVVSIAEYDDAPYAVVRFGGFGEEDLDALEAFKQEHGTLRGYPGTETISGDAFWRMPVDVLAPCAREGQITKKNAPRIAARLVAEGANGPTTHDADAILARRGVEVVPDIFANAAGVIVSYFEMTQNTSGERWTLPEVQDKLRALVTSGFEALDRAQKRSGGTLREAAFDHAVLELLGADDA